MRVLTVNKPLIWKFVGCVSAINALICFGLSSTYKKSFGKFGFGGLVAYVMVCLIVSYLIVRGKRIQVSQKFQGLLAALIYVVICVISVLHDKLLTGKSDALTIISYGLFALMSLSMSRNFEIGFETGFSTFFLSLFAAQLFKVNWILLPIALVFCSLIILLRHFSESKLQFGSITPNNGYHLVEVGLSNEAVIDIINEESQDSPGMGEASGQSLLSTSFNQEYNEEESSQSMHHSPSIGQVSEGSISDWDNLLNSEQEEEDSSSLPLLLRSPSDLPPLLMFGILFGIIHTMSFQFQYWDIGHIYVCITLYLKCFKLWAKSFRIPRKFHGLVAVLFFVVMCSIFEDDNEKLVATDEKSNAWRSIIILYASFARKSEFGLETELSTFSLLSWFAQQLYRINWILLPISAVSGQRILCRNNQQNKYQEESSSHQAEFWGHQDHVSSGSGNYNTLRMKPAIQNLSSNLAGTWRRPLNFSFAH